MAAQPSQAYKDQLAGLDSAVMNAFRAVHNLKVCLGQPSMPLLDRVSEDVTRSEVEMQLHYMNILNFVRPMTNLEQHKVHVEALLQVISPIWERIRTLPPLFAARLSDLDLDRNPSPTKLQKGISLYRIYSISFLMHGMAAIPFLIQDDTSRSHGPPRHALNRASRSILLLIPPIILPFFKFGAALGKAVVASQKDDLQEEAWAMLQRSWHLFSECVSYLGALQSEGFPAWAEGWGAGLMTFLDGALPLTLQGYAPGPRGSHTIQECYAMVSRDITNAIDIFLDQEAPLPPAEKNFQHIKAIGTVHRWIEQAFERVTSEGPLHVDFVMKASIIVGITGAFFQRYYVFSDKLSKAEIQDIGDGIVGLLRKLVELAPAFDWKTSGSVPAFSTDRTRFYAHMIYPLSTLYMQVQAIGTSLPAAPVIQGYCLMAEHLGKGVCWKSQEPGTPLVIEPALSIMSYVFPQHPYLLFGKDKKDSEVCLADVCRCYEAMIRAFVNIITHKMPSNEIYKRPMTDWMIRISSFNAQPLLESVKRSKLDLDAALNLVHTVSKAVVIMAAPQFAMQLEKQKLDTAILRQNHFPNTTSLIACMNRKVLRMAAGAYRRAARTPVGKTSLSDEQWILQTYGASGAKSEAMIQKGEAAIHSILSALQALNRMSVPADKRSQAITVCNTYAAMMGFPMSNRVLSSENTWHMYTEALPLLLDGASEADVARHLVRLEDGLGNCRATCMADLGGDMHWFAAVSPLATFCASSALTTLFHWINRHELGHRAPTELIPGEINSPYGMFAIVLGGYVKLAVSSGYGSPQELSNIATNLLTLDSARGKRQIIDTTIALINELKSVGQTAKVKLAAKAQDHALRKAAVLAAHRRCANPTCTNMDGNREARIKVQKCGGCQVAFYCGAECQKADWAAGHKEMCKQLKSQGGKGREGYGGC